MKMLKKTKIAILSFVFMILIAGYVNYKYNPDREKDLGQTVYVNGKDNFTYENVSIYDEDEKEISSATSDLYEEDAVAVFKYDRDNMFSELSENYNEIINNENTSAEKINEYQDKLNALKVKKNLIIMVEDVIRSNEIADALILPTENDNFTVILKTEKTIEKEDIAKVQQILVDQLGANANKITITVKEN